MSGRTGKYGLQLRGAPAASKPPPLKKPSIFNDDEEDDVEQAIARQALKSRALKEVEQQHKSALEQDPTIFDYDAVYDEMKAKSAPPVKDNPERTKPKYITKLMEKAKRRQQEHDIVYERKLTKERALEDHLYGDKDKFVTAAYKNKLAEQAKWLEEERLRDLQEQAEEVTKKSDLSDFYRNLFHKNVAFGKFKDETALQGPSEQLPSDHKAVENPLEVESPQSHPEQNKVSIKHDPSSLHQNLSSKDVAVEVGAGKYKDEPTIKVTGENSKGECESTEGALEEKRLGDLREEGEEVTNKSEPSVAKATSERLPGVRKSSEDIVASAKERYLSRKRMRAS